MDMDATDRALLMLLSEDARVSHRARWLERSALLKAR